MLENSNYFDFSDYPSSHPCFEKMGKNEIKQIQLMNKKRLGKFKDEMKGYDMEEFVGLRAKVYAFKSNEEETKKLKGIKRSVVKQEIHFAHYKSCIINRIQYKHTMNTFKSTKHELQTIAINKTSLSCYDDKRYICNDGIRTLPHGHYSLNKFD